MTVSLWHILLYYPHYKKNRPNNFNTHTNSTIVNPQQWTA